MALGVFILNVLIPIEFLAFLFTAVIGLFGAAHVLDRIGALASAGIFDGVAYLASALLILGAVLAAAVTAWNFIRRLGGEAQPPPLALRWPWFLVGAALALACQLVVPSDLSRSSQPVLAGALVLATAIWAIVYAAYLFFAIGKAGVSLSWRIARASPFGAGMLTLACLGSTVFVFMLGAMVDALQSQTRRLSTPRASAGCDSLTLDCSRQFLLASATATGAPSVSSGTSRTQSFRDCLESGYQDHALLSKARGIAAQFVDSGDVPDVVYASLLSVCLNSDRYDDFAQFFLRSVRNGAYKWRKKVRTCSIESEPEPACELRPDDEYLRAEVQHAVQKSLCSLGEEHRQVLFMRYFDDMSEWEISQQLGIEYATARKRLQRARDKLEIDFRERCR